MASIIHPVPQRINAPAEDPVSLKTYLFSMGVSMAKKDLGKSPNDQEPTVVLDPKLREKWPLQVFRGAVHRTFYANDQNLGLSVDPNFQRFFERLSIQRKYFLDYIGCQNGYHTASDCSDSGNPSEFLASLATSTYSRHFVKRMKRELPRYRTPYLESLRELRDLVRRKASRETPLCRRISLILDYLAGSD